MENLIFADTPVITYFLVSLRNCNNMGPSNKDKNKKAVPKPTAATSPPRKAGREVPKKKAKNKIGKNTPTISCYNFTTEFGFEAYTYTINDETDGFVTAFKKYMDGDKESAELDEANFTSFKVRRVPGDGNEILKSPDGFWRRVMVRHPPTGESNAETREEGLRVLKEFFMNPVHTAYPPDSIATVDCGTLKDHLPLDQFFQDNDIAEFLRAEFADSVLNTDFFNDYTAFAKKLWSGPNYPDSARHKYGFP